MLNYCIFIGLKCSKNIGSALYMAEKFVAHMSHTNLGVAKFRMLQISAIEAR